MKTGSIVLLLSLLSAGCSQEVAVAPPPPSAPRFDTVPPGPVAREVFSVDPDSIRDCEVEHHALAATVKWSVAPLGVKEVALYIENARGERKLWLVGVAAGQATTGEWVSPGLRFLLMDRASGKALAALRVGESHC